jgi:hypothetical protein
MFEKNYYIFACLASESPHKARDFAYNSQQADGWSPSAIYVASKLFVLNSSIGRVNSFSWVFKEAGHAATYAPSVRPRIK